MKIAVIDLGTNTFNLLIVDVFGKGRIDVLHSSKISVKLGEGGINKNYIEPLPFQRGLDAISEYVKIIRQFGATDTYAFGTSAIRGASNGKEFVNEVKKRHGLEILIISGDKEAELIYYGVRYGVKLNDEKSLIVDIGGGSTEFIIANQNEIFWKHSFDLGVARILEKFSPSDPILEADILTLEQYFGRELQPLFEALKEHKPVELIGSSGSFDSFAEMITSEKNSPIDFNTSTFYEFDFNEYDQIHDKLLHSDKAQRLNMPGLIEMRVDMIVIASIFVSYLLKIYPVQRMRMSAYALKMGALWEIARDRFDKTN
jgi:exopolyphosphatase/guanosine-5'-triphosphate,3'-diphosphate pyrophosphatase